MKRDSSAIPGAGAVFICAMNSYLAARSRDCGAEKAGFHTRVPCRYGGTGQGLARLEPGKTTLRLGSSGSGWRAFLFKVRGCILRSAAASSQSSSGSNASGDAKRDSADGLRRPFPDTMASCEFWLADMACSLTAAADGGSCSSSCPVLIPLFRFGQNVLIDSPTRRKPVPKGIARLLVWKSSSSNAYNACAVFLAS